MKKSSATSEAAIETAIKIAPETAPVPRKKIARLEKELRAAQDTIRTTRSRLRIAEEKMAATQRMLDIILSSECWRITKPIRLVLDSIKYLLRPFLPVKRSESTEYDRWIRLYDSLSIKQKNKIKAKIDRMNAPPLLSVVMPTYNTPAELLKEAIDSVKCQLYPHWELCIADDASTKSHVRAILGGYAKNDTRIKVCYRETNGHISEASNSALALANGEFVVLLDHDDVIPENALYEVAVAIRNNTSASLIYSDEDKLDFDGMRCEPYFKSDWNPDLFLSHNLFSHLGVYKRELVERVGGFRKGLDGSQDYDLALRCIEIVGHASVYHIPKVLYHWRKTTESTAAGAENKPYAAQAAVKAIGDTLARQRIRAKVTEFVPNTGCLRVKYKLPDKPPKVSIIIPTRDAADLVRRCLVSLFEKTTYPNYEIILVDNGSKEKKSLRYFQGLTRKPNVIYLRDDSLFNYSRLNNLAVDACGGEVVCLLNNDTEVLSPGWLDEMVSHAIRPGIGAVGARLWYSNNTLQHGGVILGINGVAGHIHYTITRENPGYFGRAWLIQNLSVVTGACLVIKKSIYRQVGGLNEKDLAVSLNDVDFCIRVRDAGYRNLWTPFAELYHHESATRGNDMSNSIKRERVLKERDYMFRIYGKLLKRDPAYSPNLSLDSPFSLAFPPRI